MRYSQRMPFEERLALIRRGEDECWVWPWAKTPRGYGHFRRDKQDVYAHRAAYELLVGSIPAGVQLDHACETPNCCNPAHLTPRSPTAHAKRHAAKTRAERTHCQRGHQLLPETPETWRVNSEGVRMCRQCYEGWKAVRWNAAATAEYRRMGQRGRPPRRQPVDVPALLAKHRVLPRADFCRNGHERARSGWKVFPNGFRICQTCYDEWHARRRVRRACQPS